MRFIQEIDAFQPEYYLCDLDKTRGNSLLERNVQWVFRELIARIQYSTSRAISYTLKRHVYKDKWKE